MRWMTMLLAVTVVWAQPERLGQAQEAPVPSSTPQSIIRGVATTVSGQPLAGATLFLLELPGSQGSSPSIQDRETVVTDAQGHFAWTVPKEISWHFSTDVSKDSSAPDCYALPPSEGGRATVALAPSFNKGNTDSDSARRDLYERATRPCVTHWIQTGKDAQMSVVAPDTGLVNLNVCGPDGRVLAGQAVKVVSAGLWSDHEGAVVYEGKTDTSGRLEMRFYPGLLRLQVLVPGIGFGSTGTFQLLPNHDVSPQLPPLAPFAHVSGSLAPTLSKPGAFVHLDDYWFDEHKWYDPHATVDALGHFTLDGVLPGQHRLVLVGGQNDAPAAEFMVHPGEEVTGMVLKPKSADAASYTPFLGKQAGTVKPTVHGRVTDMTGKPVAEADVYALSSYQGAIRAYQEVLTARTGTDGGYLIADLPVGQGGPSVSLVTVKAGFPVAVSSALADSTGNFQAGLVLPNGHPGLAIRVLHDGKPLAGASVRLTPQTGTGLFNRFYVGSARGPASSRVADCLEPSGVTDTGGEVRFRDLAPGLWDVTAVSGNAAAPDTVGRWNGGQPQMAVFGTCRGVAVTTGPARRVTLSVYPQPGDVALQVRTPEGLPPADPSVALGFGLAGVPDSASTSLTLDKNGNGHYSLTEPGLWRVDIRFRDTALDSFPASAEPLYEGSALLAVSSALPLSAPTLIRTMRRGPGRIRVRLTDRAGRPALGSVFIGDTFDNAQYAASLDASGEAVFPDMSSGSYLLKANFATPPAVPTLGREGEAFPPDAALSGVSLLVPQTAVVTADTETQVTFRPQPQGYLRGQVTALDSPANYAVYQDGYSEMPPVFRYDKKTGAFVAGPFPPGKTQLRVQRVTPDAVDYAASGTSVPVEVLAGRVAHVPPIPAPKVPAVPAVSFGPSETVLTMGGVFSSNRNRPLTGRVFLPDGTTPAWGARAALVVPETWQPVQMARSDALGRLTVADYWYSGGQPPDPPPGSPTEPVVVAWLPGANGAVIVPDSAASEAKLVLPCPVAVSGRITVGGKPILGLPSSFRILAAYQGRGKLNLLLSVDTTAQADGTFIMAGLTPGTYRVQAARDNLWLSETQTLVVASQPLRPLKFDIAPPGVPMLLHFTDASGTALPGRTVTLNRPSGPMTDLLWPRMMTTDTNGDLRLDGLEAGRQAIDGTLSFPVPPISGAASPLPLTRRLVLLGPTARKE